MIRSVQKGVQKKKKKKKRPTKKKDRKKKILENAYWIKLRISVPLQPSHASHQDKWVAIGCTKKKIAESIWHTVFSIK